LARARFGDTIAGLARETPMVELIKDGDVGAFADFDNRYLHSDEGHGVRRSALEALPVIDVAPFVAGGALDERRRVAAEIRKACVDIGFFYITGHGIPVAEMDAFEAQVRRFFERPLPEKMKIECSLSPHEQGFMRAGGLDPEKNPDKAGDVKERLFIPRDVIPGEPDLGRYHAGHAQWPDEADLPGFRACIEDQIEKRTRLAHALARALALSLGLEEDELDAHYRYPGATLALNYYPPVRPGELKENQWSFSPHTDYGSFTILQQDATGGLEVRNANGEWIGVPPLPGTFVINIGDLFAMSTNDLYTSNLHRAVNFAGRGRVSAAYFIAPQGAAEIGCLHTCHGPDNPPRHEPVIAEAYQRALVAQAHRTGRPGIAVRTAKRFRTR
jgi:isopenicillin N synthase-like dioxygenase